ncbi:desmethyl-deoxy-podophyllotoxin synthase-like [Mercurialis annua]|uniref:desmethyl-deoxy-podophyllotoxin synthase-like n=1 Tax=Mercurialis annua TaxID=3986 RepID=UPI0021609762|nr:desmethyl-deoxy-podophyllotoxin synthase-like [Mercurialis annua]
MQSAICKIHKSIAIAMVNPQQLFSFPMFIPLLLFIFMTWKILKKYASSSPKLPPGPSKLPLIGSIHHLIHPVPHHRLRDLSDKHGPIMHLQLGQVSTVIISSPDIAKLIMKTHDANFADRPFVLAVEIVTYNFKDIGAAPYGEYWRNLRKLCTTELLSMKRVQSFRSIREEEVSKMVESIALSVDSPVNFSKMVTYLTYGIISRAAFGKVWEGEEIFVPVVQKLIEAASGFNIADIYPSMKFLHVMSGIKGRVEKLHKRIDLIFDDILNEHKAKKIGNKIEGEEEEDVQEDFVDVLLKFQGRNDLQFVLSDESIKAVILDMFSAGSETSSTTVEWAMAEMMKNPKVLKKAQEEVRQVLGPNAGVQEQNLQQLPYLKMIIKETLRLHPPFPLLLPRECRENCVINGYDIPSKSKLMVNVWAIGRDPNYWSDPESFIPERFIDNGIDYKGHNFEFLPFGAGRRMCPGISFGIADVEFPLAMLLYHFDWKLPKGLKPEDLDMAESFGAGVRKKDDLYLIPTPYFSQSED